MGNYRSIALKRFMYSGQVLEYRDLGINFDTFELCDTKRLDSEQPGNSNFFDEKVAYFLNKYIAR